MCIVSDLARFRQGKVDNWNSQICQREVSLKFSFLEIIIWLLLAVKEIKINVTPKWTQEKWKGFWNI
jgi:hypothetical protein